MTILTNDNPLNGVNTRFIDFNLLTQDHTWVFTISDDFSRNNPKISIIDNKGASRRYWLVKGEPYFLWRAAECRSWSWNGFY